MKQERHNIFKRTHKGLRSMLFDTGTRIQQTDFTKPRDAKLTMAFIRQTTRVFAYHIRKEDSIIYHAVAHAAPFIVAMIEKNNTKDIALAQAIEQKLNEYPILCKKQDQVKFGMDLQAAYFEFTAIVLQHMNKEETVINDLLWTNYTDRQLLNLEAEIMNQLTPEDGAWYTGRIMKGLTNPEIIVWINGMMEHAAPFVAEKLIKTARAVLPIERWQMIRGKFSVYNAAA